MQLELVAEAIEQRRAASRTKASGLEFARLTGDRHCVDGEDGEGVKDRALPLAAIQAMTDSNATGAAVISIRTAPHMHPPLYRDMAFLR